MFLTVLFLYQTATNVSEYNITALMHEILTGEKYIPPKIEDEKEKKKEMATLQEIREEEIASDQMGNTKDRDTPKETVHATQGELQDFLLQTSCSFVLVVSSKNTPRAFRKNPAKLLVTSAKGKGPLLLTQSGTVVQLTRNSE